MKGDKIAGYMQWRKLCAGAGMMFVLAVPFFLTAPVLLRPLYNILDAPLFCDIAQQVELTNPRTYLVLERFKTRAQYGYLLYMFPCYFSVHPVWRAWVHSGLLLLLSVIFLYSVLSAALDRKIWAAVAASLCVINPSFTENYYTLFKAEPWMLTGMLGNVVLLRYMLGGNLTGWKKLVGYVAGILAALLTFSLKETGVAFMGVLVCGVLLIGWAYGDTIKGALVRTWPLLAINAIACGVELYLIVRLPKYYDASGLAGYDTTVAGVCAGLVQLRDYVLLTAPYTIPAGCVLLLLAWTFRMQHRNNVQVRRVLGWAVFLLYFALGMLGLFVPWQGLEARQYLVAATILPAFAAVTSIGGLIVFRHVRSWMGYGVRALGLLSLTLMALHVGYSVVLGPLSEGRVRHALDRAYDAMFEYITTHAPTQGVVHFLMDWAMPEPIENTRLALKVFYKRPDIDIFFPRAETGIVGTGLVVVADYEVVMNYNRMPLHHEAQAWFDTRVAPRVGLVWLTSFVCRTEILYVTNTYHGTQYKSVWGVPAFWDLKRGVYRFGWRIYALTNVPEMAEETLGVGARNVLVNSSFVRGLAGWSAWGVAGERTNQVSVVRAAPDSGSAFALRIENPRRELIGLKQHVPLVSGEVYRLSAAARSVATNASDILFGGRVAVYLPPQPEQQLIWMSEYNRWWQKELVFTNQVTGTAVVYVHLGYGNVATTGEFTGIRLEKVIK